MRYVYYAARVVTDDASEAASTGIFVSPGSESGMPSVVDWARRDKWLGGSGGHIQELRQLIERTRWKPQLRIRGFEV